MLRIIVLITCAALAPLAAWSPALAVVQDFDGPPAGTVVAGERPGGGSEPGTMFSGLTLGVVNTGGGPSSLIIFDSAHPTGEDPDLGTPNEDFGGPGIGAGGESGQPGENAEPHGNLIIIAEDIVDAAPADGLVDDPDDEQHGGTVTIGFPVPCLAQRIVLVDIEEATTVRLYNGEDLVAEETALPLGNNSVQELSSEGVLCTRAEIVCAGSFAIAEIEYSCTQTSTETKSWGAVKQIFR